MKKILAVFTALGVSGLTTTAQLQVRPAVMSGPSTLTSGVAPADFATTDNEDLYSSSEAPNITRIYYGVEVTFPSESSVTLAECRFTLQRDGMIHMTNAIPIFIQPGTSSFPYVVAYNNAGVRMSSDFTNTVGTPVLNVKRLVIGNHRFKLASAPGSSEQPALNRSYVMGYTITGTYTPSGGSAISFQILPGGTPSNPPMATYYNYSVVAVRPTLTPFEWFQQLVAGGPSKGSGNSPVIETYTDPSGLVNGGGYYIPGWDVSTDLVNWTPWNSTNQEIAVVSGNTIRFQTREIPGGASRLFLRLHADRVVTNWWVRPTTP